jgi:hypothetical protein
MLLAPSDPTLARDRFRARQRLAAEMMDVSEGLGRIAEGLDQLASRVPRDRPGAFEAATLAARTAEELSWTALRFAGRASRE